MIFNGLKYKCIASATINKNDDVGRCVLKLYKIDNYFRWFCEGEEIGALPSYKSKKDAQRGVWAAYGADTWGFWAKWKSHTEIRK